MARRNDFLEGIQKGVQAYLQTRQMMQQYKSAELNQQYMAEMTNRMKQPQEKPWGSTPQTYEEKLQIENRNKPPQPDKPKAWVPTTMDEKLTYDEEKAKRIGLGKYKPSDGGDNKNKPSLFKKYGVPEKDTAALDKAIRANSKGTQVLGRDKEGDYSVVKAEGEPKSYQVNPLALGDDKIDTAVSDFLDTEVPSLKRKWGGDKSLETYPPDLVRQLKYVWARRGFNERMIVDSKATAAAWQIVDVDNADLLRGDKALANHIRRRIDAWKTKGEPLFQNAAVPKTIEEASAQVAQWVPMIKNSTR